MIRWAEKIAVAKALGNPIEGYRVDFGTHIEFVNTLHVVDDLVYKALKIEALHKKPIKIFPPVVYRGKAWVQPQFLRNPPQGSIPLYLGEVLYSTNQARPTRTPLLFPEGAQ